MPPYRLMRVKLRRRGASLQTAAELEGAWSTKPSKHPRFLVGLLVQVACRARCSGSNVRGQLPHWPKPKRANKLVQPAPDRGRPDRRFPPQSQAWAAHHLQSEATQEAAPKAISENREAAQNKNRGDAVHSERRGERHDEKTPQKKHHGQLRPPRPRRRAALL